jgi:hypothetical protein
MSVFELTFSLIIAAAFFIGSIAYIIIGKRRNKTKTYQWKPEQDYDVVQEGESAMTPAYPKLVKREKK